MGFFSTRKTVSVASVVYNLAGDPDLRPDFKKTALMGALLSNKGEGVGPVFVDSYMKGPGIKLRNLGSWSRSSGYADLLGLPPGSLSLAQTLSNSAVAAAMTAPPGQVVRVQSVVAGLGQYSFWVDQYMLDNHPTEMLTDYLASFDRLTGLITLTRAGGAIEVFSATDLDQNSLYLYVLYQTGASEVWGPLQLFIYKKGSGNTALDAFFAAAGDPGEFLPFVPLRINNAFVSETHFGDVYPKAKRALRRSVDASFDDLIEKLADNPSLSDIDYAYVTFGVSLNTKENAAKRYIYEFFQELALGQLIGSSFTSWETSWSGADSTAATWQTWADAQDNPASPLYNTPEPTRPAYPSLPTGTIRIASTNRSDLDYDMRISWNQILEQSGTGLLKPDAKPGELWIEKLETTIYEQFILSSGSEDSYIFPYEIERIRICWQVDATTWRHLTIRGLVHVNGIYGGHEVRITAFEALDAPDESGFLLPLHEGILKQMPLTESTQMASSCCYLVLNCFTISKERWYETGWFKVVLIIAVITFIVVTGGAGLPSAGVLGTNAAVGAALGYVGTAALVAGAIANAIAAMLISQFIGMIATSALGPRIGAIVAVIATLLVLQIGSALSTGTELAASFSSLMRADNLLRLTIATGNGAANYMAGDAQAVMQKTERLVSDYTAQSREIADRYAELVGGPSLIDPQMFTESPDTFLARTTMTGTDLIELSNLMISSFTELTIRTDLPG